jgi:hypothetical protein
VGAQPTTAEDPFDLGDTEFHFNPKETLEVPSAGDTGEAGTGIPTPLPEGYKRNAAGRLIGPDGKFAPEAALANQTVDVSAIPLAEPKSTKEPHPQYLVDAALDIGYEQAEIDAMPAHFLYKTVHNFQKKMLDQRSQFAKERQIADGQVRVEPKPEPVAEPEYDWDKNPDNYDPHLAKGMKRLKALEDENRELKKAFNEQRTQTQQREVNRNVAIIDAAFAALGPRYEALVGKGPAAQLGQAKQKEYKRRLAILNEAGVSNLLDVPPGMRARIKDAADTLYGLALPAEETPQGAYEEVHDAPKAKKNGNGKSPRITPEQWEEGTLARPTQRKAEEVKGEQLAVDNLAKKLRDQGETIPDSDELDGFL